MLVFRKILRPYLMDYPPDVFTSPVYPTVKCRTNTLKTTTTSTPKLIPSSTLASKKRKKDMSPDISELLLAQLNAI